MAVIAPNAEETDGAMFGIEGEKTLFGTEYVLEVGADGGIYVVTEDLGNETIYRFTAKIVDKDDKSVGRVSPSSQNFSSITAGDDGMKRVGLELKMPAVAGDYRLIVEFQLTNDPDSEKITRAYPLKVVDPIILSVTVKNTSTVNVVGLDFQFIIDGEKMEITNKGVDLEADATSVISYKWVVDNPRGGQHTYEVTAIGQDNIGRINIEGLDKEFTFYIGQDNYSWLTAIMVVLLVILAIFAIWIIRKPIKNYGKPKGRR